MDKDITALAYEEAQRLLEACFSFDNPYTCMIESSGVPFEQQEDFYQMVEEELLERGEKIRREGSYFKILRFQKIKWFWPNTTHLGGYLYIIV